nr:GNAT family N-acetyltransferase [Halobacillus salinus]
MENEEINQHILKEFFNNNWGSPQMVLSSGSFQCDRLPGYTIVLDGSILGCVTFVADEQFEIISLNSVKEGAGIGTELMDQAESYARSLGYKEVKLTTTNDNLKAVRFYQNRGFRVTDIRKDAVIEARKRKPGIPEYNDRGIPIQDEWILVKEL